MTGRTGSGTLRTVLVVCLGGLYFAAAMGVALLSSGVYSAVNADAAVNSAHRTALSYVVNQVRRGDAGRVSVVDFGGSSALRLTEVTPDGSRYSTLIYCYGGQLCELYAQEEAGLAPEDGIAILPLEGLDFSVDGPRLTVTATGADGHSWRVCISPRTGLGEVDGL